MAISKLILDFLSSIAWPIVVISLAIIFKNQIVDLINRISDIDINGNRINFAIKEAVRESKLILPDIKKATIISDQKQIPPITTLNYQEAYSKLIELSKTQPEIAIFQAYNYLETNLLNKARLLSPDIPKEPSIIIQKFIDSRKTDVSILNFYNRLRDIRNQAVHFTRSASTIQGASNYVGMAINLAAYFDENFK